MKLKASITVIDAFFYSLLSYYSYLYTMNKVTRFIFILLFWSSIAIIAQTESPSSLSDSKYREDQFYAGFSYSMLSDLPKDMRLRGLSGSLQVGFLRDMPLNPRRNIALAAGIGLNVNRYGQNLYIEKDASNTFLYHILGKEGTLQYSSNRLGTYILEFPVQFRWRGSTADKYQFWRIYGGITAGYVFRSRAFFKQPDQKVVVRNISDIQKIRWSASLSFGYNKINFFAKYDLNNLFKRNTYTTDGEMIAIRPLQFGFIFYIL